MICSPPSASVVNQPINSNPVFVAVKPTREAYVPSNVTSISLNAGVPPFVCASSVTVILFAVAFAVRVIVSLSIVISEVLTERVLSPVQFLQV